MLKNWFILFSMMFMCGVVDDAAGGASGETPEPTTTDADAATPAEPAKPTEGEPTEPKVIDPKEYEALQATVMELAREKQMSQAIASIKASHGDFDEKKVHEHLKTLAKTDPAKAQAYNNPIGWEAVWLSIRPKAVDNDPFSGSRKTDGVDRRDEIYDKVKKGEVISVDDQAQVLRSLLN